MNELIPKPVSVQPAEGCFAISGKTTVTIVQPTSELNAIGAYLASHLEAASGYSIQVAAGSAPTVDSICLATSGNDPSLGEEGYELVISPGQVTLSACQPAGLFRGSQTIRQLLAQPGSLPAGTIRDYPRFPWRGAMLDVSRHFFGVADVKRYIDLLAYYKMNRLHLHLSNDQGWRVMIASWPNLALHGGSTQVGGGKGGYYTQAEYAEIVAYAQSRYVVIVPEIDMPGHTNAALASYADLNCSGVAPALYTGIEVGFSSLCIEKEITYRFVDDVVRELAALTPWPYIHIGGDEAHSTRREDYLPFIERLEAIVQAHGKQIVGWEDIGEARISSRAIAQHWHSSAAAKAVQQGAKVIMSPASRAYLDMKYDENTRLGLAWAGTIDVHQAYDWDPASQAPGVGEADILGVEAPLWTETIETMADIEFLAFPRLIGIAEIGWSRLEGRNWEEYKTRLGAHGPRLAALGVNYYPSPEVPWLPQ